METQEKNKTPRIRRGKKEIEKLIWDAFERLVIKDDFNGVTLIKLAREAGVEPPVIYSRFENEEDLFNQYVKKNDFWLNDKVQIDPALSQKENLKKILIDLINNLYENEIMQRILLWALNDTHKITRRLTYAREYENTWLIKYLNEGLGRSGIHFDTVHSILISGIYYLILHRNISTFSTVDFSTEEGKSLLLKTIPEMIDKIYANV
ncbi:transcriptional regulator [Bacteroidia bacterium]|nr:transcriptional regulator [Bacteroidia bacterium]